MTEEKTSTDFIEIIRVLGKPVSFYPLFSHIFSGNVNAALFLSNFMYWEGKQHDDNGWIYKNQTAIYNETGLSRYQQESARKILRSYNVMQEARRGQPAKLYYKFDWEAVNKIVNDHLSGEVVEKGEKEPSYIYRMREVFDKYYQKHSKGVKFDWSNKRKSKKHWGALKNIYHSLYDAIARKKLIKVGIKEPTDLQIEEVEVTEDEVINTFDLILSRMPEWYVKHAFTPFEISENLPKIIIEIQTDSRNGSKRRNKSADEIVRSAKQ